MTTASDHGWRIRPSHALTAATLCWLGFAAVAMLMQHGCMDAFDAAGLRFWRDSVTLRPQGPAGLRHAVADFTALGGSLLRNLFALAAVVALLFLHLRREAALLAMTVIAGMALNSGLKLFFARPRPAIVPHLAEAGGHSFPSGHTFNAAVVYIAVALAFATISPLRRVRWTIVGGAMASTLLIALSRVWLGVHYPSDVLAGWLGGAAWAFTASALLYRPAKAVTEA